MAVSPPTDLSSVAAYLDFHSIPFDRITPLSGGFTNYIFLISHATRAPFVLKHSSTNIKSFPSMSASTDRADYEVRALQSVPELLEATYTTTKAGEVGPQPDLEGVLDVHLPVLLHYEAVPHVQHQVPCGVLTLKAAYSDAQVDIPGLGCRLGRWLARLHAVAPVGFADNAVGVRVCGAGYRNAPRVLDAAGLDSETFRQIVARYEKQIEGAEVDESATSICHGDFWPGNVLLSIDPEGNAVRKENLGQEASDKTDDLRNFSIVGADTISVSAPRLTVLDWEMSRRGNGATDVGQFAAEAWLLDTFRGNRGLLEAFLSAYAQEAGLRLTPEVAKRAGVHMGVHLAYWPSMIVPAWADEAGTRGILERGRDLVVNVEEGGVEWMRGSVLSALVTRL